MLEMVYLHGWFQKENIDLPHSDQIFTPGGYLAIAMQPSELNSFSVSGRPASSEAVCTHP
jgi:hypothetical protein